MASLRCHGDSDCNNEFYMQSESPWQRNVLYLSLCFSVPGVFFLRNRSFGFSSADPNREENSDKFIQGKFVA